MPYPDYIRRERFEFFLDRLGMLMPMIIELCLAYGVVALAIALAMRGTIPSWLASPLALAAWAYANHTFWLYQAWRSSGRRGRIINPWGPRGSDMQTAVLWFSFGVFFHLYHVWLRSNFARNRRRRQVE